MSRKLIIIIVFLVVLIVCLLSLSLMLGGAMSQPGNGNNNGESSATTISSIPNLVGLQDPDVAARYVMVAIKPDDTVAVVDPGANNEIVLNLEHRNWASPKWSPDGKLLAVLGTNGNNKDVRDLFIYSLAEAKWEVVTNYASFTSGIQGFDWLDDQKLAYTQGENSNFWLHRYDYPNRQISKEFQTDVVLLDAYNQSRRFLVANSARTNFRLEGFNGKLAFTFNDSILPSGSQLQNVIGVDNSEVFLITAVRDNKTEIFVWDFNNPELVRLNIGGDSDTEQRAYQVVCMFDAQKLALVERVGGQFNLRLFDRSQSQLYELQTIDIDRNAITGVYPQFLASCTDKKIALGIKELQNNQAQIKWKVASLDAFRLQSVRILDSYRDLDLK